jgi:hypothetical protein
LVPIIVLEVDIIPRLGAYERGEVIRGHHIGLAGLAIFSCRCIGQFGKEPHTAERDACAEAGGGFGDKASAAGPENAEDFFEDGLAVCNDEEKSGDDDSVDGVGRIAKRVCVSVGEGTVLKAAAGSAGLRPGDEAARKIDAGCVDLGILLREPTGIKAGAAAQLKNMGAGSGSASGEERERDLLSVIAEEVLATESVKPGAGLEEAIGRTRGSMSEGSPGYVAVAWFHS